MLRRVLLMVLSTAVGLAGLTVTAAPALAADPAPLFISEVAPDNGSHVFTDEGGTERTSTQDNFEFFEVANPGDTAVDLTGHTLRYGSVTLTLDPESATVVPARGALTLWLRYSSGQEDGFSSGSPNAFLFDDADFRAHYGLDTATPVGHVTGQPGMANGGDRTLTVAKDGAVLGTTTYLADHVGPELAGHYAAPAAGSTESVLFAQQTAPTPGALVEGQLNPQPDPDPDPEEPTVPEQGPPPAVDPDLRAPLLQVTEVAPDTENVDGADGYEFVEVYNASESPIGFEDFSITYLYIDASAVTTNATRWPASPKDRVIQPGQTLVLWVKNGANGDLTVDDFNQQFGARLTSDNLVEMQGQGMANGGLRGIQVTTNTGEEISTSYYFNNEQTTATTAIQYAWNPAPSEAHLWVPPVKDGAVQTMTALATPTPGYAAPEQVPGGLVADPAEDRAPVIRDLTGGTELPETEDLVVGFDVTDDHQVRTVELTLTSDVGEPQTRNLTFESPGRFTYVIPAADVYGKRWVDYTVVARDGTHVTTLGPKRIDLADGEVEPLRISGQDGQYVSGTTRVTATAQDATETPTLTIDDQPVDTQASLEKSPIFAFEATSTDAFFRNGVKIDDQELLVFDEGFYDRVETVAAQVPVERIQQGNEVTVGIYAGTKANPGPDPDENNDDFTAFSPRLALPDGRVLRPVRCAGAGEGQEATEQECPEPGARIAFSDANQVYFLATFEIPDDAYNSVAHTWDTTAVADGEHTIEASAGEHRAVRTLRVDNTAPEITTPLEDGTEYRGAFSIDAAATDAGSGVASLSATLDGQAIELPLRTSSVELAAGDHTVELTATDRLGNVTTTTVSFTTPEEQPSTTLESPAHDAEVRSGDVVLTATPRDPTDDELDVEFRQGHRYAADADEVKAYAGTTGDASKVDRPGRQLITGDELTKLTGTDGLASEVSSDTEFPYQLLTVDVPADAGADATVRLHWAGSANADAKVILYVLDTDAGAWEKVDQHLTTAGAATEFTLGAEVPVAGHAVDGTVTALVQHSEGFTTTGQSERGDQVPPYSAHGVTPRSTYDFTIGWESDTQYYNQTQDFHKHQLAINRFLVAQRSNLDLQYVVHTGDIVNDWDQPYQWANADPAYRLFDDAGLPYGVLAGNHDVGHHAVDYGPYGQHFGEARFAGNPWYGGSYKNNRGSYNLISADGVDLLFLSMGWGAGDAEIAWMNEVIRAYPERKVVISLHEFMLTTGGLGPIPQRVQNEVVKPNANVIAVTSGHYHDAFTRTDDFDDDGDGNADRTVYSMLFDYQGLPEGGLGYLRLLHFDNQGERIIVRTYSPSLDDFDAEDPSLEPQHQEFEIPYAAGGIEPVRKTLATDEFRADVLTSKVISSHEDVASGTTLEATWSDVPDGEHGWYVVARDPYGAVDHSEVRNFTAVSEPLTQTPTPTISGTPAVGETLTAEPGEWGPADPEVELAYQWSADGEPIAGATEETLDLRGAHVGARITVTVTGSQPGYESTSVTSEPTVAVAEGELVPGTPTITGTPEVGQTLTAEPGEWGPADPGVELTYQWSADGEPLAGATGPTLDLAPEHAGATITVTVTGTQAGYADASVDSEPTAPVADAPPSEVTPVTPRITGVAKVGSRLTAEHGKWGRSIRLTYQWSVGGEPVPGATRRWFRLTSAHVGRQVTVTVTGTAPDGGSGSATSRPTRRVAKGTLRASKPRLVGPAKVRGTLRVQPGRWTQGTRLRYVWRVGGRQVKVGGRHLRLRPAYAGKRTVVTVTGTKMGYVSKTRRSAPSPKIRR